MHAHLSLSSTITLTPRRAGLCADRDNVLDVLLRVQAPDAPAEADAHRAARPPQALALVIDRSGSMAGRPLAEARRCAAHVVSRMRATDAVALVQFDGRVHRLWPAQPVGDGQALRAALDSIHAGGNTNLHGGWQEGVDTLATLDSAGLRRVLLLSDGQANEGLTDADAIAAQCAHWAGRGITTTTCGLGRSFNEELMMDMARAGGGNAYYGETAEDLMDPFEQELSLLDNLCLRELRLDASTPDGVTLRMLNHLPTASGGGWQLPDLTWGAQAWAVCRLSIPATALPPPGQPLAVLRVSVTGQSLDGEPVQLERTALSVPVLMAQAHAALADVELVARRLDELDAANALTRMRDAANEGDWPRVQALLDEARERFAGNEWVAAMLTAMQTLAESRSSERVGKEAFYASRVLRYRLAARDEDVHFSVSGEAQTQAAHLRRKVAQGKGSGPTRT